MNPWTPVCWTWLEGDVANIVTGTSILTPKRRISYPWWDKDIYFVFTSLPIPILTTLGIPSSVYKNEQFSKNTKNQQQEVTEWQSVVVTMCQALCWLPFYTHTSFHPYTITVLFHSWEDLELGVDKGCEVVPSSANPSQAQHLPLLEVSIRDLAEGFRTD